MGEIRRVLEQHAAWLMARARYEAGKYRRGTSQATIDDFAGELFGDAAERFIRRAEAGWFDQKPRVSFEAQVKELLYTCLRQARTDHFRSTSREILVDDETRPEPESDAGAGDDEAIAAIDRERARHRLTQTIAGLTPGRRLWYLAIHRPYELTPEHVRAAAAFRQGGGTAVARPVEDAWALYEEQRADRRLVGEDARWKRTVAAIFRLKVPLEEAKDPELSRAVNTIDVQLHRVFDELGKKLGEEVSPTSAEAETARRLP